MRSEGFLVTTAGIEPATFRFISQHFNHCATAVPDWCKVPELIEFRPAINVHNFEWCPDIYLEIIGRSFIFNPLTTAVLPTTAIQSICVFPFSSGSATAVLFSIYPEFLARPHKKRR